MGMKSLQSSKYCMICSVAEQPLQQETKKWITFKIELAEDEQKSVNIKISHMQGNIDYNRSILSI